MSKYYSIKLLIVLLLQILLISHTFCQDNLVEVKTTSNGGVSATYTRETQNGHAYVNIQGGGLGPARAQVGASNTFSPGNSVDFRAASNGGASATYTHQNSNGNAYVTIQGGGREPTGLKIVGTFRF